MPSPHTPQARRNLSLPNTSPSPAGLRTTQNTPQKARWTDSDGNIVDFDKPRGLFDSESIRARVLKWQDFNNQDDPPTAAPNDGSPSKPAAKPTPIQKQEAGKTFPRQGGIAAQRARAPLDGDIRAAIAPKKRVVSDQHWQKDKAPEAKDNAPKLSSSPPKNQPTLPFRFDSGSGAVNAWVRPKPPPAPPKPPKPEHHSNVAKIQLTSGGWIRPAPNTVDKMPKNEEFPGISIGHLWGRKSFNDEESPLKLPKYSPQNSADVKENAKAGRASPAKPIIEDHRGQKAWVRPRDSPNHLSPPKQEAAQGNQRKLSPNGSNPSSGSASGVEAWLGGTSDPFVDSDGSADHARHSHPRRRRHDLQDEHNDSSNERNEGARRKLHSSPPQDYSHGSSPTDSPLKRRGARRTQKHKTPDRDPSPDVHAAPRSPLDEYQKKSADHADSLEEKERQQPPPSDILTASALSEGYLHDMEAASQPPSPAKGNGGESRRPNLKRKLTSHADLISVLSMPPHDRSKSLRSACSVRSSRTKPGSSTVDELMAELRGDEARYLRELQTLVDGVVPVLLTCVLSKGKSGTAIGLFGSSKSSSDVTTPIVNMGVALERLKGTHRRLPSSNGDALLVWAQGAYRVYADYLKAWRMGFQDVVVNLAPAERSLKNKSTSDNMLSTNENGDVINTDGEKADVAFLLKRPLVRLKNLAKTLKGIALARNTDKFSIEADRFQDLVAEARKRQAEERGRLEDEAAASIDGTRARDLKNLGICSNVHLDASRCVQARDLFDLRLNHSTGQQIDCRVELIIRHDPRSPASGDVLICEVDHTSRWLLFPPVELRQLSARQDAYTGELIVMIRSDNSFQPWHELISLKSHDDMAYTEWLSMLGTDPMPPECPPALRLGGLAPQLAHHNVQALPAPGISDKLASSHGDVPFGEQDNRYGEQTDAYNADGLRDSLQKERHVNFKGAVNELMSGPNSLDFAFRPNSPRSKESPKPTHWDTSAHSVLSSSVNFIHPAPRSAVSAPVTPSRYHHRGLSTPTHTQSPPPMSPQAQAKEPPRSLDEAMEQSGPEPAASITFDPKKSVSSLPPSINEAMERAGSESVVSGVGRPPPSEHPSSAPTMPSVQQSTYHDYNVTSRLRKLGGFTAQRDPPRDPPSKLPNRSRMSKGFSVWLPGRKNDTEEDRDDMPVDEATPFSRRPAAHKHSSSVPDFPHRRPRDSRPEQEPEFLPPKLSRNDIATQAEEVKTSSKDRIEQWISANPSAVQSYERILPQLQAQAPGVKVPESPSQNATVPVNIPPETPPHTTVKQPEPDRMQEWISGSSAAAKPKTPPSQMSPVQLKAQKTPVLTPTQLTPSAGHRRSSSPLKHEYAPSPDSDDDSSVDANLDTNFISEDAASISSASSADDIVPSLPPMSAIKRGMRSAQRPHSMYEPRNAAKLDPSAQPSPFGATTADGVPLAKQIASIFCWSNKGLWDKLHPDECSVVVSAGMIEAFEMSEAHSIPNMSPTASPKSKASPQRPQGIKPLIALELTPLVPLRRGTAIDISMRSPPTAESKIRAGNNIMFRSRNNQECDILYNLINQARINNPTYIALQNARSPGGDGTWAKAMDNRASNAGTSKSWWRLGVKRSSYRAGSSRRSPSLVTGQTESSVATMSTALSALKRFSGGSKVFDMGKSKVESRSGSGGTGTRSSTTFSSDSGGAAPGSGTSTPPAGAGPGVMSASDGAAAGVDPSQGLKSAKIRLYERESQNKWRDMGSARLTVMHPPRPPGMPPQLEQDGQLKAEKRVLITGKTEGEKLLDVTLGESAFERVARTGIAVSVWTQRDEVEKTGGVTTARVRVYMVQMKSEAETAYTFSLVGRLRY